MTVTAKLGKESNNCVRNYSMVLAGHAMKTMKKMFDAAIVGIVEFADEYMVKNNLNNLESEKTPMFSICSRFCRVFLFFVFNQGISL